MSSTSEIQPLLVSVKQARQMLGGCSNNTIWRLIKAGELEVVGSERKRWCSTASIERYVARQLERARQEREQTRSQPAPSATVRIEKSQPAAMPSMPDFLQRR
jgi:hypothetical protein